jgi:hypothetical protein
MAAPIHRRRYETVTRELYGRQVRYFGVCLAAVVLLTAVHLVVFLPAVGPSVASLPLPSIARTAILMVPFGVAVVVIPGLVQWLLTPREERAAFEALNTFALLDRERWLSSTGAHPRGPFRTPQAARTWIAAHPGVDPVQQARVLTWDGDFAAAGDVIARQPDDEPIWRAHRLALRSQLEHVRDNARRIDLLDTADTELEGAPPSPQRDYASLSVALERARLDHAAGAPPWRPFARTRERLSMLPHGASTRDRWIAGMRTTAVLVVIMGAAAGFAWSR